MPAAAQRPLFLVLLALACAGAVGCGEKPPATPAGHPVPGLLPEAAAQAENPLATLVALLAPTTLEALARRLPEDTQHARDSAEGLADAAATPLGSALAAPPQTALDESLLKLVPQRETVALLAAPAKHVLEAVIAHAVDAQERARWDAHQGKVAEPLSFARALHTLLRSVSGHAMLVLSRDPTAAQGGHVWTFLLPLEASEEGRELDAHAPKALGRLLEDTRAVLLEGITYSLLGAAPDPGGPDVRPAVARVGDALVVTSQRARMEHVISTHMAAQAHPSILADPRCRAHLDGAPAPSHAALWVDLKAVEATGLDDLVLRVQRRANGLRVTIDVRRG